MLKHEFVTKPHNISIFPWIGIRVFFLFNVKNKPTIPHLTGMQLHNCKQLLSFTRVQCCLSAHNNTLSAGTFTIFEKYKISIILF